MNLRHHVPRVLATLLLVGLFSPAARAQVVWTGLGIDQDVFTAANWQGGTAPAFDGTEDLILGKAINNTLSLSGDVAFNSISLTANDSYHFIYYVDPTITIGNGVGNGIYGSLAGTGNQLVFDETIDFTSVSGLNMDAGNSFIVITGKITGPHDVYLSNARGGTTGAFIFNSTCTGSSYTGDTYITGVPGNAVVVAFWNDHPFGDGTGLLHFQNTAQLIAHGNREVDNDISIESTGTISLKSWDNVLDFDGDVTLNAPATFDAQRGTQGVTNAYTTGVIPMPGPITRNPIVFTGNIGENGVEPIMIAGGGLIVFEGINSYSGGTLVGGSLVFANSGAAGGGPVTIIPPGYAGFADPASGHLATFLANKIDPSSPGAIGVDTLPGDPINTFTDAIDLTGFTNANIRIGTATRAILAGTITPKGAANAPYRFGNGGGTLYVQSSLTGPRAVNLANNSTVPLTLYLQSFNSYSGGTTASSGFIIFDGVAALPGFGQLAATGAGSSYIGYTDSVGISATTFLGRFKTSTTTGIIGFDTNASTLAGTGPVTITDNLNLALSGFNNGVYLGTTTGAIFSGTLTPTADGVLRLTAALGSTLEVDSPLSGGLALSLGTNSTSDVYSNGTVYLPNANSFTGGTTINSLNGGLTLKVGDNNSLGTGALTIPQNVIAGLQASAYYIALPNDIVFSGGGSPGTLYLTGGNGLELDGVISGPGTLNLIGTAAIPNFALYGNNTFTGDLNLYNATLSLYHDHAAGLGTIRFLNNSSLNLNTPAPVIYGIAGEQGSITMNAGQSLTIDLSNSANAYEFGGHIGNEGTVNASLTVTSTTGGDSLYLYGHANFSGGTTIVNNGALALGSNDAIGSGPVTLNTTLAGALAVNAGVTFSNDLIYIGGALEGFGTFAPNSVNSVAGAPITFGTGQGVVAGAYGLGSQNTIGRLTLGTGAVFANGGGYLWMIQDGSRTDGFSTLFVNGANNLNITATGGQFTIYLASLDNTGAAGFASNLILGANNTFLIAQATGGGVINGFDPADFTIDTTNFANPITNVYLSTVGTDLLINFTPVPEPSTYALLGLGLGALVVPAIRRRKRW